MTQYVRIQNGVAVELFTPPAGFAIADCFVPAIAAQFVPVPVDATPAQGWTATETAGVWTFAAPVAPAPTLAQQAATMLAAGCQIVSTGTPAINGTYACDPTSRATIAEVVAGINAGDGFPGGGSSFVYPLPGGATFPSTTVFLAFARAMRDFIYAASVVAATNTGTLPTQPVTIT